MGWWAFGSERRKCAARLGEDGTVECTAPVFDGAEVPFDALVTVALDGQVFGTAGAIFRYDAGAAKGGKKK